jgi:hypothetical protein
VDSDCSNNTSVLVETDLARQVERPTGRPRSHMEDYGWRLGRRSAIIRKAHTKPVDVVKRVVKRSKIVEGKSRDAGLRRC